MNVSITCVNWECHHQQLEMYIHEMSFKFAKEHISFCEHLCLCQQFGMQHRCEEYIAPESNTVLASAWHHKRR